MMGACWKVARKQDVGRVLFCSQEQADLGYAHDWTCIQPGKVVLKLKEDGMYIDGDRERGRRGVLKFEEALDEWSSSPRQLPVMMMRLGKGGAGQTGGDGIDRIKLAGNLPSLLLGHLPPSPAPAAGRGASIILPTTTRPNNFPRRRPGLFRKRATHCDRCAIPSAHSVESEQALLRRWYSALLAVGRWPSDQLCRTST